MGKPGSAPDPRTGEELDSDLRRRLNQETILRSLRPVDPEGATRGQPEEPATTKQRGAPAEPQQRDGEIARVALPRRMGNWQELSLLPLPDDPAGVIGQGGQAVIFSYVQRELGRGVAVKALRPERREYKYVEDLVREACVTARLEHPNIVPVHYLHLPEHNHDAPYWVMKRIHGQALTAHLPGAQNPWPIEQLLDVFRRVLDAVAFAHSRGIVHRDLKPDNVLVGAFGEVQVTDWGLAVAITDAGAEGATPVEDADAAAGADEPSGQADARSEGQQLSADIAKLNDDVRSGRLGALLKSHAGGRAGTPAYMAPEQLEWTADGIEERTDVFLLGGVLYAMLTGDPPHNLKKDEATDEAEDMYRAIRSCSTILSLDERRTAKGWDPCPEGLSSIAAEGLSAIVMHALSPAPSGRYESVESLGRALDEWESQSASAELTAQAQERLEKVESARRLSARAYAEVIALTDASLAKWEANDDAQRIRDEASTALGTIQRRSAQRLWAAAAAILLTFVVGGVGYQRTRFQRNQAQTAREDAEAKAKELAEKIDDLNWEDYRGFKSQHDYVGQLLAATAAQEHCHESGVVSARLWWQRALLSLEGCPRLVGRTPSLGSTWRAACFSPVDELLASADNFGTIRLWRPSTGRTEAILRGHSGPVNHLSFSPDGTLLASASEDNTIKLWELAARPGSERPDRVLATERASIVCEPTFARSMAFASDDLLIWSDWLSIRLWDVARERSRGTLKGDSGWLNSIAVSPDGTTLAIGGKDAAVRLWDVRKRCQKAEWRGHVGHVTAVSFSPDGTTLASGGKDGTMRLWDVVEGCQRAELGEHAGPVTAVSFSPDGLVLASASRDTTVKLWDPTEGRPVTSLAGHTDTVECIDFSADGRTLVSGGRDMALILWDIQTKRQKGHLEGHRGAVHHLAVSPDGATLASAGEDSFIRLWDVCSGRERAVLRGHTASVYSLSFDLHGTLLASGSEDATIRIWDTKTGRESAVLRRHEGAVRCVSFSAQGTDLASAGDDRSVRLWDVSTWRERAVLERHGDRVNHVAFSPNGAVLASVSDDRTLKLWDVRTRRETTTLRGHDQSVNCVSFRSDGTTLASASDDRTAMLWDASTGRRKAVLNGHGDSVNYVCFGPKGRALASASEDGTVRLWDVTSDQARGLIRGHAAPVRCVAFLPDGVSLACSGTDPAISVAGRVKTGHQGSG